jgi:hypothetical protein
MDETLLDAFRRTHYLVCLDTIEWADIRVDEPPPPSLQARIGPRAWGFVTAWNPGAQRQPPAQNLAAQRVLLQSLERLPDTVIHPAIGIGVDWHEPSLMVIGLQLDTLDALARRHQQLAYVHGTGDSPATLRVLE